MLVLSIGNQHLVVRSAMQDQNLPELLTLREACQVLHVHANTLRNWERTGKLQAVRIGPRRDRRFTKQSLLAMFEGETAILAN